MLSFSQGSRQSVSGKEKTRIAVWLRETRRANARLPIPHPCRLEVLFHPRCAVFAATVLVHQRDNPEEGDLTLERRSNDHIMSQQAAPGPSSSGASASSGSSSGPASSSSSSAMRVPTGISIMLRGPSTTSRTFFTALPDTLEVSPVYAPVAA